MSSDFILLLVFFTQLLLALFGVVFFCSGLDDFFVDLMYVICRLSGRERAINELLSEDQMIRAPEQTIAMMIPAWDEAGVIGPMLGNSLRTIAYANYHIFIGIYPNDPGTFTEVSKLSAEFSNVHPVMCGNPGPTCKADCLNWIYRGIRFFEKDHGLNFDIFLMEDCEDLVHPLCLKLFTSLIPAYCDMAQIPVFPLENRWYNLVAGHYIDEFAEFHGKDIFVREMLAGSLPAAGVGCAFSRRAFEYMARRHNGELFNTGSLTEDYEFGLGIGEAGFKSVFVSQLLPGFQARTNSWHPRGAPDRRIAVREHFPANFHAAVRQKSRWVMGIALQGWRNLGWKGGLARSYMLFRDRKAIVTNQVSLMGYFIVLLVMTIMGYAWLVPDAYRYPPLVERGSLLWNLLLINFVFLVNRSMWRFYCVYRVYGGRQAFLAVSRQICSNIVNGFATTRALWIYGRAALLGRKIAWDKTTHVLPTQLDVAAEAGVPER